MPWVTALNDAVPKGLTASKQLAEELRDTDPCSVTKDVLRAWYLKAARLNQALAAQNRQLKAVQSEYEVHTHLIKEAMRSEMIDREGNNARVADNQKSFLESQYGAGKGELAAFERAATSAAKVEQTLLAITAQSGVPGEGCAHLLSTN